MNKKTRGNGKGSIAKINGKYVVYAPTTYYLDGKLEARKKQPRLGSFSTREEAEYILNFYNSLPKKDRDKLFHKEIDKLYQNGCKDKLSIKTTISKPMKDSIIKTFDNKCAICGMEKPLPNKEGDYYIPNPMFSFFHIHHIIPKSLGGEDSELNLVPLCPNCHALLHTGTLNVSEKELKEKLRVAINNRLSC